MTWKSRYQELPKSMDMESNNCEAIFNYLRESGKGFGKKPRKEYDKYLSSKKVKE